MPIDHMSSLIALLLAVSLAAERIVALAKTLRPSLAQPAVNADGSEDDYRDRERRLAVQAVAFAAAWVTAALVAAPDGSGWASFFSKGLFGTLEYATGRSIPVPLVGLLASGGSAFWSQLLGYSRAVKELRQEQAGDMTRTTGVSVRAVRARHALLAAPAVERAETAALAGLERRISDRYSSLVPSAVRGEGDR